MAQDLPKRDPPPTPFIGDFQVVINEHGERLESCFREPLISSTIDLSVHVICGAHVNTRRVSETHKVIICSLCFLRVVIPNSLKTLNSLKEHFKSLQI